MKPTHPVIKIITLSVFIVLISGFVLYRTGKLDKIIYADDNCDVADSPVADSIPNPDVIISSSKSTLILHDADIVPGDTPKPKPVSKNVYKPPVIMSGSKSMSIPIPRDIHYDPVRIEPETTIQQQEQKPKK